MKKTKIIHLIGSLSKGGAERFIVDLCNELALNEQYRVKLVSICGNDQDNSFCEDISPAVNYISLRKGKGFSLSTFLRLTSWLKVEQPDIVHSHLNGFEYLSLYILQNKHSLFFHTIHNVASAECPSFLVKKFRRWCYKSNRVKPITISLNGRSTYKDYYRLDNDILIKNGRPKLSISNEYVPLLEKYRWNTDHFILLHIGRIAVEKNQEMLIKAVQQLNETSDKKCRLLIIGEVKDRDLYKKLLRLSEKDPHITFLGAKNNIADYLSIADIFCLSSTREGMPISLIEALSMGCISVCTPVGGISQMISHGKTGFLSKDGSLDSYCNAIKEALGYEDKELIRSNSKQAFKQNYHIKTSAECHSETYSKLLTESAG